MPIAFAVSAHPSKAHNATALVGENHQDDQQPTRRGRHHEEIRSDELCPVIR